MSRSPQPRISSADIAILRALAEQLRKTVPIFVRYNMRTLKRMAQALQEHIDDAARVMEEVA